MDTWAGLTSGICAPLVNVSMLYDDINANKYNVHKTRRDGGDGWDGGDKVAMPGRQKQSFLSNTELAGENCDQK